MAWIASLKIVLISSGVVALAWAMKLSVPLAMEFVASHLPLVCASFRSLLRPPYIYVLINGIIITIVASSRFHHDRSPQPKPQPEESESTVLELETPAVYEQRRYLGPLVHEEVHEERPAVINDSVEAEPEPEVEDVRVDEDEVVISSSTWTPPKSVMKSNEIASLEVEDVRVDEDEVVISSSTWTPPKSVMKSDQIASPVEKPLVSVRFSHRKPARSSPEGGKPLRVAKPKRHDTLENTWKAITEGRSMPLSRHMKKSETWENHGRQVQLKVDSAVDTSAVLNSETFKDWTNQQQVTASAGGVGKLRKEPSLSQDELNRRVEAFINKFNEEMRLQRQESLNQYMETVKRGSH
ncbi:PREDICTED: uncharacterized protein LOC103324631 isoform X2 [Prunus mume]|uniref:Uncharacterized protein LOC103324631 isoform X2 n=1 Tax=Prunus mume TaxID=102107 RepID=A0ABM0NHM4_PRUMU|nr:PREDICTED: uncharacterized protein LOC103324631 isoform X2 [Prunus mume]